VTGSRLDRQFFLQSLKQNRVSIGSIGNGIGCIRGIAKAAGEAIRLPQALPAECGRHSPNVIGKSDADVYEQKGSCQHL